jgi:Tol biopolymer transport system component
VRRGLSAFSLIALFALTVYTQPATPAGVAGLREPAWSADGKRLAVVFLDRIFIVNPDGRDPKPLTADAASIQREPAWSSDGRVAFSMDRGDGFDLYVAQPFRAAGRRTAVAASEQITKLPGDERGAAWTPDGRIVFSHRAAGSTQWDLFVVAPEGSTSGNAAWASPERLIDSDDNEVQPRVSPDGHRVAFASDRDNDEGDVDIWTMKLPARGEPVGQPFRAADESRREDRRWRPVRIVQARGLDGYPAWSPDGARIAFYAVREGIGSTWVTTVDPLPEGDRPNARAARERPTHPAVLVSRHGARAGV